ncbi:PRC-barrel domain-containing protein [Pedobacter sp. SYSU D00535]|uniref:PRC-barrel domain-containing protein n=1 Tax=Pedobacter sp. SYSU D00535 TaxID=2810308 RepID=UPI001A96139C|nr:PRC-barrel domain-containing protein [Pedobacter sp. SYSU D00535]
MLRNVKSLLGYKMGATDGDIGEVKGFYFDDQTWTVRYLVVETGNWFSGKKVLISTDSVQQPDFNAGVFPINLTREQIKNGPDIDTEKPVSREHEQLMHEYYPWNRYWQSGYFTVGMMAYNSMPLEEEIHMRQAEETAEKHTHTDTHLRSTSEVKGYSIHASDGSIGEIDDFVFDDQSWKIEYMVADIGGWFKDKKILIPPRVIRDIRWEMSEVVVSLSKEEIKDSPHYDESMTHGDDFDTHFGSYYGRF